jgi:predicted nucleotidyltransferase
MQPLKLEQILEQIIKWTSNKKNFLALALVGSYAKENFNANSDIDLMFLTPDYLSFKKNKQWLDEIDWKSIDLSIESWHDATYGVVWSRHVYFKDTPKIEFSFGLPSWASINPVDRGTYRVINNGCRILYDPQYILQALVENIRSTNKEFTQKN